MGRANAAKRIHQFRAMRRTILRASDSNTALWFDDWMQFLYAIKDARRLEQEHKDMLAKHCPLFFHSFYRGLIYSALKTWKDWYDETGLLMIYSLRLQRLWRGVAARKAFRKMREEDDALEQEVAAIFIQKTYRGMAVRNKGPGTG